MRQNWRNPPTTVLGFWWNFLLIFQCIAMFSQYCWLSNTYTIHCNTSFAYEYFPQLRPYQTRLAHSVFHTHLKWGSIFKMPAYLNSIFKGVLQASLILIFWIYFGRLSINRFQRQDVLVSSSTIGPDPEGLQVPAITICARNTSTSLGWKGNPNVTSTKEVLVHTCGAAQNVTKCILEKTFGQDDI